MKFGAFDYWHPAKRKPDNDRVYMPWNNKFMPKLFGRIRRWDEPHYQHEWKNGILDALFDGPEMEAEAERVAKLMDELE